MVKRAIQLTAWSWPPDMFLGSRTSGEDIRLTGNAGMGPAEVYQHGKGVLSARSLVKVAQTSPRVTMNQLHLSVRGYRRILRLARVVDIAGSDSSVAAHIAEVLQYRSRDRV